jgi:hypothetical protein
MPDQSASFRKMPLAFSTLRAYIHIIRTEEREMTIEELARNVALRMRELDSDISKSLYNRGDNSNDRPPEGGDYNDLWDAILDEFKAAGISLAPLINP